MNGGDTDTGGAQVNPSNTPPSNPGPRPVGPVDPSAEDTSMLSISHDQQNPGVSQQPIPQPGVQASTTATPKVTADPIVSFPTPSTPNGAVPNTTSLPTQVPYPAANINSQPQPQLQPADQLITQTFTTNSQPTQVATADPVTQYVQTPYPQRLAPHFSNQPPIQLSQSGNEGDIIINAPSTSKSKRSLVIAGIALLISSVAACVILIIINLQTSNTNEQQHEATNYREAFNQYANHVLYGNDSSTDILAKPDNVVNYAIWDASNNKDIAFFDKAKNRLNNFMEQDNEDLSETTNVLLQRYINVFDFYYLYNTTSKPSYDMILEKYIQDGKDVATTYINDNYKVFEDSSELAQIYGANQKEVDLSILDQIDIAASNGCLKSGVMDQVCMGSFAAVFSEQRSSLIDIIQSIKYDASEEVVNDCYILANEIYKTKENQDVE